MAKEEEQSEPGEKAAGSKKKLIMIIGGVVGVLVIAGAGLFFTGFFDDEKAATTVEESVDADESTSDDESDDSAEGDAIVANTAIYHALTPPFMVNFSRGGIQVMKIAISVMASEQKVIDAVEQHNPVIRNNILMMLSSEDTESLKTISGKLALQSAIKAEINKTLNKVKVSSTVKDVFFTEMVMQ